MTASELLDKIDGLIPLLRELADAGELEGDYWPDLDHSAELLEGVVQAFDEPE